MPPEALSLLYAVVREEAVDLPDLERTLLGLRLEPFLVFGRPGDSHLRAQHDRGGEALPAALVLPDDRHPLHAGLAEVDALGLLALPPGDVDEQRQQGVVRGGEQAGRHREQEENRQENGDSRVHAIHTTPPARVVQPDLAAPCQPSTSATALQPLHLLSSPPTIVGGAIVSTTWDPGQYLKFRHERTQPSIDLASRIALPCSRLDPRRGLRPRQQHRGPARPVAARADHRPRQLGGDDRAGEGFARLGRMGVRRRRGPRRGCRPWRRRTWCSRTPSCSGSPTTSGWFPGCSASSAREARSLSRCRPTPVPPSTGRCCARRTIRGGAGSPPGSASRLVYHEPSFYYEMLCGLAERLEVWETTYHHELAGPPGAG